LPDDVAQFLTARLSRLRKLFAAEQLPPPPPAAAVRHTSGALRHLIAIEPLAHDPERPSPPRRSWLRLLLAPEPLPRDPPPPPRPRRPGWLRLLLGIDRLD
jgi:hypothetical protein